MKGRSTPSTREPPDEELSPGTGTPSPALSWGRGAPCVPPTTDMAALRLLGTSRPPAAPLPCSPPARRPVPSRRQAVLPAQPCPALPSPALSIRSPAPFPASPQTLLGGSSGANPRFGPVEAGEEPSAAAGGGDDEDGVGAVGERQRPRALRELQREQHG